MRALLTYFGEEEFVRLLRGQSRKLGQRAAQFAPRALDFFAAALEFIVLTLEVGLARVDTHFAGFDGFELAIERLFALGRARKTFVEFRLSRLRFAFD